MRFIIPYPPSVNRMWRTYRGRILLSKEGRAYYDECTLGVASQRGGTMRGPVKVRLWVSPPDRRRRDLDNVLKPIMDLGTKAKIWDDDSQLVEIHATKEDPIKGGRVVMEVKE